MMRRGLLTRWPQPEKAPQNNRRLSKALDVRISEYMAEGQYFDLHISASIEFQLVEWRPRVILIECWVYIFAHTGRRAQVDVTQSVIFKVW